METLSLSLSQTLKSQLVKTRSFVDFLHLPVALCGGGDVRRRYRYCTNLLSCYLHLIVLLFTFGIIRCLLKLFLISNYGILFDCA